MSAAVAGEVRLRPGAAVHPVDEGLLFCGWRSSALMTCGAGVITLWQAVAPALAAGVDPARLRDQLPGRAMPAFDTLLSELGNHRMLTDAAGFESGSPAAAYLAQFAPDVRAAGTAAALARLRLVGEGAQVSAVAELLDDAGLGIRAVGQAATMTVYLGSIEQFQRDGRPAAEITALGFADRVLVADTPDGPDRLLQACRVAVAALAADTAAPDTAAPDTAPGTILMDFDRLGGRKSTRSARGGESTRSGAGRARLSWALARSIVVERVHRQLAGLADPAAATLVSDGGAVNVRLAELPRPARPVAWSELRAAAAVPTPEPATAQAMAAAPELGAQLTGPLPGDLPQVPLSRQLVEFGSLRCLGAGADQHRAGQDAVRNAARAQLRSASGDGWQTAAPGGWWHRCRWPGSVTVTCWPR